MAFWTQEGGGKDPKRGFRFKVIFTGHQGGENLVWWAKKVSKPNFSITESKHQFLNHSFYWPGRVEWQPISMTLVDPAEDGVATVDNLIDLVVQSGYILPQSGASTLSTMSKSKSQIALGNITIHQMDAEGKSIETWELKNPWVKMAKFGDLSYDNDDLTEIEMELRYDWAELKGLDGLDRLEPE